MNKQEINQYRLENQTRRNNAIQAVEFGKSIERLVNNPDFIKVIQEGFCDSEMRNYVCNAGDDNLDKEAREHSLQMALAGGHLTRWLGMQIRKGLKAQNELVDIDAEEEHLNQMDQ